MAGNFCSARPAVGLQSAPVLAPDDFVPDFILPAADGTRTRLYGIAGGVPTLVLFAAGEPAAGLIGELSAVARARGMSGFVVLERAAAAQAGANAIGEQVLPEFVDPGGAVRRAWGVGAGSAVVLLDPSLRVVDVVREVAPGGWAAAVGSRLDAVVADPEEFAPVLSVPRVFDAGFCRRLIELAQSRPGLETGVEVSIGGARQERVQPDFKRRSDYVVDDAGLSAEITERLSRRLLPAVWRAFSFRATRFEGFKIGCYAGDRRGRFKPHRDNLSPATAHRRFALSLNLNDDYEGGWLRFAEYGPRLYRPAAGGALVFSGSLLHEALEVTAGSRYVLISFLYRAEDGRRG